MATKKPKTPCERWRLAVEFIRFRQFPARETPNATSISSLSSRRDDPTIAQPFNFKVGSRIEIFKRPEGTAESSSARTGALALLAALFLTACASHRTDVRAAATSETNTTATPSRTITPREAERLQKAESTP